MGWCKGDKTLYEGIQYPCNGTARIRTTTQSPRILLHLVSSRRPIDMFDVVCTNFNRIDSNIIGTRATHHAAVHRAIGYGYVSLGKEACVDRPSIVFVGNIRMRRQTWPQRCDSDAEMMRSTIGVGGSAIHVT